ncbi:MAG TPA: type II and III secretion system protein [Candidatus Sulfotelmatobacter sp.]
MRRTAFIIAAGLMTATLTAPAFATGDDASSAPPISCGNGIPGGVNCIASKKELKEARNAFREGLKLQDRRRLEEAFTQFDTASRLAPQDTQFLTAREVVKAQLVFEHVQRGNLLMLEDARARAAAEFRAALGLDGENQFVQERLAEASREMAPALPRTLPVRFADSGEIHLQPKEGRATFHYSGEVRGLFAELSTAYGVAAQFDDSVQPRQVRFNIDNVDFFTALKLVCQVSKTMWAALDAHQMLIATDNAENHKQFDRMSLRTFILPPHSTPQEATDIVTTLRNMFELKFVSSGQASDLVEVRGPQPLLEACSKLMEQLGNQRPQVMLDIRVYQINHQLTRNIGVHIPNTFNMYNIPAAALAGLGGASITDLINQLIASGGINQAGSTALSGLLAQLGGQQNSIFSQPLATFGGGLTFMGLSLDHFAAALSVNESWVRSLENMTMRASQGNDATFHLGEKFPILNASYAPIYNSSAISAVLGNQTYVPPFPSVSYEDLGLNMKAKPTIHGDGSVSLQLELQVRSLTGQSSNGVPVISNREYRGSITLKDGEPAVVAGEISQTDTRSMSGIPGLGFVPGLNQAMVNNTKQSETDELMIVITPHVLANYSRAPQEIWISEK